MVVVVVVAAGAASKENQVEGQLKKWVEVEAVEAAEEAAAAGEVVQKHQVPPARRVSL